MIENRKYKYIWTGILSLLLTLLVIGIFSWEANTGYTTVILMISAMYLAYVIWANIEMNREVELQKEGKNKKAGYILAFILLGGIVLRIYIGMLVPGYQSDMACWTAWSQAASGSGLFEIYRNSSFLDYPPGYIYILHIIGSSAKILGIDVFSPAYMLMLKTPSIIADIVTAWIIYKIASKKINIEAGLWLSLLYVINPLVIIDSAAWGQIDSILSLAVIGYLFFLYKRKIVLATLVFVVGLLIKPQMLFFGPVLAVVYIKYLKEEGIKRGMKVFFSSLFSGIALFVAVVIPFGKEQPWYWIFEKYMGTIGSYNYITLNSANLYGLLGLNWMSTEEIKWGISLFSWGIIGLVVSVMIYFIIAFFNKNRKNLFINTAMLMTGIYALGLKMHERYIFPVIVILLLAYVFDNRNSIFAIFGILGTAVFINIAQVLVRIHIPPEELLFKSISAVVVAVYIGMVVLCAILAKKSRRPELDVNPLE